MELNKIKDFIYEIKQVQANGNQGEKEVSRIVKLGLSGSSLVVRQGGGYYDLLDFLERK